MLQGLCPYLMVGCYHPYLYLCPCLCPYLYQKKKLLIMEGF